jgi:hypothetical protein
MATEFSVWLEDHPGTLADLAEAMAKNAVNIVAIHATPCPGKGITQFVTNHPDAAMEALSDIGLDYTTREVLLLTLSNEPGKLAQLARALATAAININSLYITMNGQIVLDVSDIRKAQETMMALGIR